MKKLLDSLPFLAFFVVLFFTEYYLFGVSDALLGIAFLFFSRTIVNEPGLSFFNYCRRVSWFIIMSLCATLAGLHPIAMVLGTIGYLLVITLYHSDDYLPRNFFWLGMGYLLLLIYPVGVEGILSRILATLLSVALTTAFIYAMRAWRIKAGESIFARDRSYVSKALVDVGNQLAVLSTLNEIGAEKVQEQIHPKQTFSIAQEYAKTEYAVVLRQGGTLSGRQSYTFAVLLCCEQLADMIHAAANNTKTLTEVEQAYYADLSHIFLDCGTGVITRVKEIAHALTLFLKSHTLDDTCHQQAWSGILETMVRVLQDTRMARDNSTSFKKSFIYHLKVLRENIGFQNTQTRFALRLSALVGIAMLLNVLLTQYANAQFGIWIPITAFAILNTYNDETYKSTLNNLVGTLLGIVVFAFFIHFIPEPYRMPLVVTLSYLLMLMDISQVVSVMAGTQMALNALYPSVALLPAIMSRLTFVVLAVTCVLGIMLIFVRTRRSATIRTKIAELERIDARLTHYVHDGIKSGRVNLWRMVQLLYYTHMNADLLDKLATRIAHSKSNEKDPEKQRKKQEEKELLKSDVERVLQANYQFAMDAEHAVMLLDPRRDESVTTAGTQGLKIPWNNPDSTARLAHIDATTERLDEKMEQLENLDSLAHLEEQ